MTFGFLHVDDLCIFLGYVGELCAVHRDDRPSIVRVLDKVCAVSDVQTCAEVHIDASDFAVNPSFSCRLMVRTGPLITLRTSAFDGKYRSTHDKHRLKA